MSKKFTGVHSGGQNIPVYDKDAHSAIEQKLNTSAFQSVSGNFLTAVPDAYATKEYADGAAVAAASGKLDTDTFAQVSGDFLTAVPQSYLQNTDLTVTSGKVTEISGIPLSAGGTLPDTIPVSGVSGISVTETENEVLIGISADFATSADLESKLDTSAFSSVSGDFLTAVPDDFATKEYLSSQISGKYDTSSFAEVSGNFLTAVPQSAISGFATHEEVESAVSGKQDASAMTAYQAAGNYLSASESANFYPMSGNPSGFLTEHQSLAGYLQNSDLTIVDDKITEISGVPLSAGDELPQSVTDAADYVSATSGNIDATIENVSSNSGVWGGSALPVSAGPGIKLEMNNGVLVASTDETVLWETDQWAEHYPTSLTLSEDPQNFKEICVLYGCYGATDGGNNVLNSISFMPNANRNGVIVLNGVMRGATGLYYNVIDEWSGINTTAWAWVNGKLNDFASTSLQPDNNKWCSPYKIIGINRVAGGN